MAVSGPSQWMALASRIARWSVCAALVGTAHADPTTSTQTVVIKVPDATSELPVGRLTDALTGQLAELGVHVQLATGPDGVPAIGDDSIPDRDVLAFIWIESTPEALVVHFYEPAGSRLRERRIPVTGNDAASVEEVAIVVRSAASALLEPALPEPTPEPAPPSPPVQATPDPDPPPPPPQPTAGVQVAVGYLGTLYATNTAVQHGASGELAFVSARCRWFVGAGYQLLPALERQSGDLTVTLRRHPTEVFVGYARPIHSQATTLRAEGAILADPIVRRTSQTSEQLAATPNATRWSWATSARLRIAWSPARPWSAFASGGADFLLNRFDHVIEDQGETTVLSPLLVRPRVQLGLSAEFP